MANAQTPVSNYVFSQNTEGTYTEISGGTIHGDEENNDESFNDVNLGFTFNFNETDFTQVSIQTNGYIAMGATVTNYEYPFTQSSGSNNIIAACAGRLRAQTGSELMSIVEGTVPNRIFIVQWKNYKYQRYVNSEFNFDNSVNFQLKLYEGSNKIEFAYGDFIFEEEFGSEAYFWQISYYQVGLRGDSENDLISRYNSIFEDPLYYDWNMTKNSIDSRTCHAGPSKKPYEGLTFYYEEPYALDIGISEITSPETILSTEGEQQVNVNLTNHGTTTITSATIKWNVNDGSIQTYNWTGSLAPGATDANINLGNWDFSSENHFIIEAWTENPNSSDDNNEYNDICKSYHVLNQYCTPTVDDWDFYLRGIVIGNMYHLDIIDYDPLYEHIDFSSHFNTSYMPGADVDFYIKTNSTGYCGLWLDYNDDNDFDDVDEFLGNFVVEDNNILSGTFTLLENATEGMHKIRIKFSWDTPAQADNSCAGVQGASFDYGINIYNPTTPPPCVSNLTPVNEATDIPLNASLTWESQDATNFDVYFGTDTEPPFVGNTIENSYPAGNLDPLTTYYWKIIAKNDIGSATDCETWSFLTGIESGYCEPISNCMEWGDNIEDFSINNFEHLATGCTQDVGYEDYTSMDFNLEQAHNFEFTVTTSNGDRSYVAIWIDYDHDGEFNNTNEFIYVSTDKIPLSFTDELSIDNSAQLGEHRFRIRLRANDPLTADDACTEYTWGETHDYTVNIQENTNIDDISEKFNIYPNPSNGIFTIENKNPQGFKNLVGLEITDITGKTIYSRDVACNVSTKIDISNQPKGIYFIKINTETGIYTEKLIIQ